MLGEPKLIVGGEFQGERGLPGREVRDAYGLKRCSTASGLHYTRPGSQDAGEGCGAMWSARESCLCLLACSLACLLARLLAIGEKSSREDPGCGKRAGRTRVWVHGGLPYRAGVPWGFNRGAIEAPWAS